MAVEARRGCGFRKAGGTYLESDPGGFACGRLPIPLIPCPLCDQRPRFTRGLQRVTPKNLLHSAPPCKSPDAPARCVVCPYGRIEQAETAGLLWVGARFYTPEKFTEEAAELGASRRVPWPLPKWFEVGKTWIFCAHEEAIKDQCPSCEGRGFIRVGEDRLPSKCEMCDETGEIKTPGIFTAFRPQRVVRIVRDDMDEAEKEKLREQGLTLVEVPSDDPDHAPRKGAEED